MNLYQIGEVVKMPRTYDATRRREQAQENRARVLDAARARFLADC